MESNERNAEWVTVTLKTSQPLCFELSATGRCIVEGKSQMTLSKSIELRWQNEVIESWLNTPDIPSEARERLLAMQREVKEEIEELERITH